MLYIEATGSNLGAKWYAATTDAKEGQTNSLIKNMPGPPIPEVCTTTLTVTGGNVLGKGNMPVPRTPHSWKCPAGSFYDEEEVCPICPVGYTCPDNGSGALQKIPCPPSEPTLHVHCATTRRSGGFHDRSTGLRRPGGTGGCVKTLLLCQRSTAQHVRGEARAAPHACWRALCCLLAVADQPAATPPQAQTPTTTCWAFMVPPATPALVAPPLALGPATMPPRCVESSA